MLKTLAVFVVSSLGGSLGWWLGSLAGLVPAFILCMVGTGFGMYYGAKWAKEYTP
jgi:uncharacterized membrane protein YfcA